MSTDTPQTVLSSFKRFFSGTLVSRFSGLFREVAMAFAFGVSPAVASFWMAFRFANLFRRLFGEGGLNVAFIPHFEKLKKKDPAEAFSFFHNLTGALTALLFTIVLLSEGVLAGFLIAGDLQKDTIEILRLTMIMLPSLIFISLFALNSALLNSEKSFFLPSSAPSVVNILWIGAALFCRHFAPDKAMEFLALILVFAFAAQWLVTYIPTYALFSQFPRKKESKKKLFAFLSPFLLSIIGVTAQQINSAIDAIFARVADAEGPAILWYALRLQQLPFALLGVGLMSALLPSLSRAALDDENKYISLLNFSLKKVSSLMIPLSFALLAGGFAGVNLLYGRGAFTDQATYETTLCLWAYGASLLPMAYTLLLASAFYAKKNYRIPTLCSVLSVLCNLALNAFFVYVLNMKAISIAIATTLSSFLNVAFLTHFLSKERKGYGEGVVKNAFKILVVSGTVAFLTIAISGIFFSDNTLATLLHHPLLPFSRNILSQITLFGIDGALFLGLLFLIAYLAKIEEITELFAFKKLLT